MDGKVLFVDDQEDFLNLLEIRLKNESYEKFFISDSKDVLNFLENQSIDVIISDMNMPKNGIELFKELRKHHPQIVRIALSGTINTRTLLMAINEGDVYRYITKPWRVDEDGKNIIREAIKYSKFLKEKDWETITIDELKKILEESKLDFKILETLDKSNISNKLNKLETEKNLIKINSKYRLQINRR